MISGFGGGTRVNYVHHDSKHTTSGLPVPFNMPNVLHNLLYEETGIVFDLKQKDMLETLRFSHNALIKFQSTQEQRKQEIHKEILHSSNSKELKDELEEMHLDLLQATYQFKDIVNAMADLLKREQYEQLLKFSNIPT